MAILRIIFCTFIALVFVSCQNSSGINVQTNNMPTTVTVHPTQKNSNFKSTATLEIRENTQAATGQTYPIKTIVAQTNQPTPPPNTITPTVGVPDNLLYIKENFRFTFVDSNRHLWYWDGLSIKIIGEVEPNFYRFSDLSPIFELSPDGKKLMYTVVSVDDPNFDYEELWVINTDGTEKRLLISLDVWKEMLPWGRPELSGGISIRWFPDSQYVLISTSYTGDIYRLDTNTGLIEEILSGDTPIYVTMAPDGQTLAIQSKDQVYLYDPNKRMQSSSITYNKNCCGGEGMYDIPKIWTPDSRGLIIALPPANMNEALDPLWVIWQLYVDGSKNEQLNQFYINSFFVNFSRDAQWLSYSYKLDPPEDYPSVMHIAKIDGSIDIGSSFDIIDWLPNSGHFYIGCQVINPLQECQIGFIDAGTVKTMKFNTKSKTLIWIDGEHFIESYENQNMMIFNLMDINGNSIELISLDKSLIRSDFIFLK